MKFNRRKFLQITGAALAASAVPAWAKNEIGLFTKKPKSLLTINPKAIPILQGPTDHESTTLIFLHDKSKKLLIKITDASGSTVPFQTTEEWPLPGSTQQISQVQVRSLNFKNTYTLELLDSAGAVYDKRTFSSLNTLKKYSRFALVSCMKDKDEGDVIETWDSIFQQNCDFLIIDGDTCYSDNDNSEKTEASYARRYSETRSRLGWFKIPKLVPTFATWDDHDSGENNADKTLPIMPFNRKMFRKFWGENENTVWKKTFGVGSSLQLQGQNFFLLDDRSYREPPGSKARQLGKEQSEWLFSELNKSSTPTWLINGSQYFGGYRKKDGYEYHHPGDFADFLSNVKKASTPVVFGSGDVHYSEIMKIEEKILGYSTYEFTSSSAHSTTFPFNDSRRGSNKPRRMNSEWRHNFMVFDVDRTNGWDITATCYKKDGSLSFRNKVNVSKG